MMRANTIIDLLIARPMRWLAGNSSELVEWSPFSMGPVLDELEALFEKGAQDGSVLLNPQLELFSSVKRTQPKYREYLDYMFNEDTCISPNGKTKHLQYKLALQEALTPDDETNARTRELTIEYLQVQCQAGLTKLHDNKTVLPEYLTSQDGGKCWAKVQQGHADTKGTEATNDKFAESVFGVFDRVLKTFFNIGREAASGLAQASRAKSFWQGDAVLRRKPQDPPKPGIGYFYTLPPEEQEALVEYARSISREMRKVDRAHNAEVAAYVKAKAKTASDEELEALITEWGFAMSFFERWQERGVRSVSAISTELAKFQSDASLSTPEKKNQAKLDWLREQIEMRTRGLQWVEFKTRWGSSLDEGVGTVADLTCHLKEILEEERSRRAEGELPDAAPAPVYKGKTFKELGTLSAQAEALAGRRTDLSEDGVAALRERAEQRREQLEAAGEICAVADRQPDKEPSFPSLLGRTIEVRWRYYVKDKSAKSGRRSEYIWCEGVVMQIADGKTDRKTPKTKDPLPWGAVRIRWPEDVAHDEPETFVWSVLKPADWCNERHLGWRYSAGELAKLRVEARKRARE